MRRNRPRFGIAQARGLPYIVTPVVRQTPLQRFQQERQVQQLLNRAGGVTPRQLRRVNVNRVAALRNLAQRSRYRAATRIQALVRGWSARRAPIRNAAATRIQALARGYLTRRALR